MASGVALIRRRNQIKKSAFAWYYFTCLVAYGLGAELSLGVGLVVFVTKKILDGLNGKESEELKNAIKRAEVVHRSGTKTNIRKYVEEKNRDEVGVSERNVQDKEVDRKAKRAEKIKLKREREKQINLKLNQEIRKRLNKNKEPDEIVKYKGALIYIYMLSGERKFFKVVDWEDKLLRQNFLTIKEARSKIFNLYPAGVGKLEYLAAKEKELRRQEQNILLAKAYKRRATKEKIQANLASIDALMALSPVEFEHWVKKFVFEIDGWQVTETSVTGDGGVDLALLKDEEHSIAQCKRYRGTIGAPALRDFYGTMMSEGVSRGFFVTTGLFSLAAQKFAQDKPIELMDRRVLAGKIG